MRVPISMRGAALLACAILIGAAASGEGEEKLGVEADRGSILLGEPVRLTLEVVAPPEIDVLLPGAGVDLGPFTLLDHRSLGAETLPDGKVRHGAEFTVTAYDVGPATLPPLTALLHDPDGAVRSIRSDSLTLGVEGVLPAAGADTLDIRPIKGQISVRRGFPWKLVWLVLGALAVLAALLFLLHRRRRRREPLATVIDTRPPEVVALEALNELRLADYPGRGFVKEHYTRLTDILRPYLERRFGFPAVDLTTSEIMEAIETRLPADGEAGKADGEAGTPGPAAELRRVLEESDLVKFARARPPAPLALGDIDRAEAIVHATSHRLASPEPAAEDER